MATDMLSTAYVNVYISFFLFFNLLFHYFLLSLQLFFSQQEKLVSHHIIFQSLYVWLMDHCIHHKVELRYRSMAHGELSAMMNLMTRMLELSVKCLDSAGKHVPNAYSDMVFPSKCNK